MLNYSCAVTDMSFWQFTIGNTSVLPVSLVWIYYGTQAATLQQSLSTGGFTVQESFIAVVGFVSVLGVIVFVMRYIKKQMDEV